MIYIIRMNNNKKRILQQRIKSLWGSLWHFIRLPISELPLHTLLQKVGVVKCQYSCDKEKHKICCVIHVAIDKNCRGSFSYEYNVHIISKIRREGVLSVIKMVIFVNKKNFIFISCIVTHVHN